MFGSSGMKYVHIRLLVMSAKYNCSILELIHILESRHGIKFATDNIMNPQLAWIYKCKFNSEEELSVFLLEHSDAVYKIEDDLLVDKPHL